MSRDRVESSVTRRHTPNTNTEKKAKKKKKKQKSTNQPFHSIPSPRTKRIESNGINIGIRIMYTARRQKEKSDTGREQRKRGPEPGPGDEKAERPGKDPHGKPSFSGTGGGDKWMIDMIHVHMFRIRFFPVVSCAPFVCQCVCLESLCC